MVNVFIALIMEKASMMLVKFNATELIVIGKAIESNRLKMDRLELTLSPITAMVAQFSLASRSCRNFATERNSIPVPTPIVMPAIE